MAEATEAPGPVCAYRAAGTDATIGPDDDPFPHPGPPRVPSESAVADRAPGSER